MPTKKPRPPDEKPQRERFIEAARAAGVDETGEEFEKAFAKIVLSSRPKQASNEEGNGCGKSGNHPRNR